MLTALVVFCSWYLDFLSKGRGNVQEQCRPASGRDHNKYPGIRSSGERVAVAGKASLSSGVRCLFRRSVKIRASGLLLEKDKGPVFDFPQGRDTKKSASVKRKRFLFSWSSPWDTLVIFYKMCRPSQTPHLTLSLAWFCRRLFTPPKKVSPISQNRRLGSRKEVRPVKDAALRHEVSKLTSGVMVFHSRLAAPIYSTPVSYTHLTLPTNSRV